MRYREDMTDLRKELLEKLYSPEYNFPFTPKITPYESKGIETIKKNQLDVSFGEQK